MKTNVFLGLSLCLLTIFGCTQSEEDKEIVLANSSNLKADPLPDWQIFGAMHNSALDAFINNYTIDSTNVANDDYAAELSNISAYNSAFIRAELAKRKLVEDKYILTLEQDIKPLIDEKKLIISLKQKITDFEDLESNGFITYNTFRSLKELITATVEVLEDGNKTTDTNYIVKMNGIYNTALSNAPAGSNDELIIQSIFSVALASESYWNDAFTNGGGFPPLDNDGDYGYVTYGFPVAADVGGAVVGVAGYAVNSYVTGNDMSWLGAGTAALFGAVTTSVGAAIKIGKYLSAGVKWLISK